MLAAVEACAPAAVEAYTRVAAAAYAPAALARIVISKVTKDRTAAKTRRAVARGDQIFLKSGCRTRDCSWRNFAVE